MFGSSELLLQPADYYEASTRLQGPECRRRSAGGGKAEPDDGGRGAVGDALPRGADTRRKRGRRRRARHADDPPDAAGSLRLRLGIAARTVVSLPWPRCPASGWRDHGEADLEARREAGEIVDRRGRLRQVRPDRLARRGGRSLPRARDAHRSLEQHIRFIESFSADVSQRSRTRSRRSAPRPRCSPSSTTTCRARVPAHHSGGKVPARRESLLGASAK